MIFLSYTWHKKTFPEIDELQCDTDYRKSRKEVRHIPEPCDMFILYQPTKVIDPSSALGPDISRRAYRVSG
jgi:hypothetical protein